MKFILAEKKEMTQKFTEDGTVIPVTKVVAGPCFITQTKKSGKDGYVAVQLGFGSRNKVAKPQQGHLKNLGKFRYLKEFRLSEDEVAKLSVGNKISAGIFKPGDVVKVTGTSKGKGFQGVVKRWGFHGSPASHGHKDQLRMPGSIGATGPAHVFKGTKMGGRTGGGQVTVTNLEIVEVDPDKNEIFIKGAVPGARNNLILLSGDGEIVIEEVKAEAPVKAEENQTESPQDNKDSKPVEPAVEPTKEESENKDLSSAPASEKKEGDSATANTDAKNSEENNKSSEDNDNKGSKEGVK